MDADVDADVDADEDADVPQRAAGLDAIALGRTLRQAFASEGAVKCGFSTPGVLVASAALLSEHPHPTDEQVRRGLEGIFCRCTGYSPLQRADQAAAGGAAEPS